jgi:hypothetical protein
MSVSSENSHLPAARSRRAFTWSRVIRPRLDFGLWAFIHHTRCCLSPWNGVPCMLSLRRSLGNIRKMATEIPQGFQRHTERRATILIPTDAPDAFINPIQEYNRDLSVACIKQWATEREGKMRGKWVEKHEREGERGVQRRYNAAVKRWEREVQERGEVQGKPKPEMKDYEAMDEFRCPKYTVLEALSATGLRSIRYAQELPNVG